MNTYTRPGEVHRNSATIIQSLIDAIEDSESGLRLDDIYEQFPAYTKKQIRNALAIATRTNRLRLLEKPKGLGHGKGSTQGLYGAALEAPAPQVSFRPMVSSVFELGARV